MGMDKALVTVGGVPMARRVADALRAAGVSVVRVIGRDAVDADLGLPVVADPSPHEGPLAGLITALTSSSADIVIVAACDLPWLDATAVRCVLAAMDAPTVDAALAITDRPQPLCGAWRRAVCAARLEPIFAAGERALHRALSRSGLDVAHVPVDPSAVRNVNTPADLGEADEAAATS
jgi:molybdopterin-guanine dinucleotide biosynthesis protein A